MLVGQPEVTNGTLNAFHTTHNKNTLTIGLEGIEGSPVLDLIAPRIGTFGKVSASTRIQAITGSNRIDPISSTVTVAETLFPEITALDSSYLGGMHAGSITLVSTAKGSGINLEGTLVATNDVVLNSQGKITMNAPHIQASTVQLTADNVDILATATTKVTSTNEKEESWFIWKTGAVSNEQTHMVTTVNPARFEAETIAIDARSNLNITATEMKAANISLTGANVSLNSMLAEERANTNSYVWKNLWEHSRTSENNSQKQVFSRLEAKQDLTLQSSNGELLIQGGNLQAGHNLSLISNKNIKLNGLIEHDRNREKGARVNEGAELQTGNWDKSNETERLEQAQLVAGGQITLKASENLEGHALRLEAKGDVNLTAGNSIKLGTQAVAHSALSTDYHTYWGGIGGSQKIDKSKDNVLTMGSVVLTEGTLALIAGDAIHITGSRVKGAKDAIAHSQHGNLFIDNAIDTTQEHYYKRNGGAFDITTNKHISTRDDMTVMGSELKSDTNLHLVSAQDILLKASDVIAEDKLKIQANGHITMDSAIRKMEMKESTSRLGFDGHTEGNTETKQYRLAGQLGYISTDSLSKNDSYHTSHVQGGSVFIDANKDITAYGANVQANQGDITLNAHNINLQASYDKEYSEKYRSSIGPGIYVQGGIDKTGFGLYWDKALSSALVNKETARVTSAHAVGDIIVQAYGGKGSVVNEGTQLEAGKQLVIHAGKMDNRVASGYSHTQSTQKGLGVNIGLSAEYGDITRKIGDVLALSSKPDVTKLEDTAKTVTLLGQAAQELGKGGWSEALDRLKSVGIPDIGVEGGLTVTQAHSAAHADNISTTQLTGAGITVNVADTLQDQATNWQANNGKLVIDTGAHVMDAVTASISSSYDQTQGTGELRVATSTGSDLRVKARGHGGSKEHSEKTDRAVTGTLYGSEGIGIFVEQHASYSGTQIDAKSGDASIKAGGDIQLTTANSNSIATEHAVNGKANIALSMLPDSTTINVIAGGVAGNGMSSYESNDSSLVTRLNGQDVTVQAGNNLILTGTQIGSHEKQVGDVTFTAGNHMQFPAVGSKTASQSNYWGGH